MSDYIDWYDHDRVEKFHRSRAKKWLGIFKKMANAKEKGDEVALKKARQDLVKHQRQDEVYKEKAKQSYFYWY